MPTVYEIPLDRGQTAKIRELSAFEFEGVAKRTSQAPDQGWEMTQHGLRLSLIELCGEKLRPQDLAGKALAEKIETAPRMLLLRNAWEQIHLPSAEDTASVRAMAVIEG